jgi:hypothetical protein
MWHERGRGVHRVWVQEAKVRDHLEKIEDRRIILKRFFKK